MQTQTTTQSNQVSNSQTPRPKKEISPGLQRRINDYNRGRGFRFIYDIYPSSWHPKWGDKPRLGSVRADSEFDAIRAAYDYRLLPYNFTFEPKAVKRKFKDRDAKR